MQTWKESGANAKAVRRRSPRFIDCNSIQRSIHLAMVPYFEQPVIRLGPLSIHAFGIAVAVALWVGVSLAQRRFALVGLQPRVGQRLGNWMLAGGLLGAHLFAVLFYFPGKLLTDPWVLLRPWEDISSFGGILGGVIAALLFFRIRASAEDRAQRWAYLDAVAFVFPVPFAIGRIGCALAHDHPGTLTTFPLAISIKSDAALAYIRSVYQQSGAAFAEPASVQREAMGFHDLGWYEFLFLTFVVVPLFQFWSRRDRSRGFYLLAFPAVYLPVRFGVDFLRIVDARYFGLTPAQWVAVAVLAMLPFVAAKLSRRPEVSPS
jgi:phosphatidylglycerol:prolipoprotein diacylglycerol transferase